jgi:stage II sporulation protein M
LSSGINDTLSRNIRENIGVYFIVTLFFAIGIAIGAFTVKALDYSQKEELVIYLNKFFQILDREPVDSFTIFLQALKNNFLTVFLIWVLSITIIGVPITLFIIAFRGFIVGFTISFLIQGLGWKGMLFALIAVLPQNILYIPCLLIISAVSMIFCLQVFRGKNKKGISGGRKNSVVSYTIVVTILFLIMSVGSAVEAYVTPFILKSFSSYMMIQ